MKGRVMKWQLMILPQIVVVSMATIFSGCYYSTGPGTPYRQEDDVTYDSLFLFESSDNWWEYSDIDGNRFSIRVIDTISDNSDLYYKVSFTEHHINASQDDWFVREGSVVAFNESLQGEFATFLPSTFAADNGSFFCGSDEIRYQLHQTVSLGDTSVSNAVQLEYECAVLHGFDRIHFSNGLGIVSMIDLDGRWPIEYTLDSCSINGTIRVFE